MPGFPLHWETTTGSFLLLSPSLTTEAHQHQGHCLLGEVMGEQERTTGLAAA